MQKNVDLAMLQASNINTMLAAEDQPKMNLVEGENNIIEPIKTEFNTMDDLFEHRYQELIKQDTYKAWVEKVDPDGWKRDTPKFKKFVINKFCKFRLKISKIYHEVELACPSCSKSPNKKHYRRFGVYIEGDNIIHRCKKCQIRIVEPIKPNISNNEKVD